MGLLDKLLRRSPEAGTAVEPQERSCLHGALIPRWDSVEDMGKEERATSYRCDSCGSEFTPHEVHELRAQALERLRDLSEAPSAN
jgi:hypothetical protein